MDKAQARILFLILIGVMFVGQAVYDFIKKNKSRRASSRRTTVQRKPQVGKQPVRQPRSPFDDFLKADMPVAEPKTQAKAKPQPQTMTMPDSAETENHDMISEAEAMQPVSGITPPDSDELRRAVIWSEILKRKF